MLLIASLILLVGGIAFAFVPLVECKRCDDQGQFATEVMHQGRPAIFIDYCDCNSFFEDLDPGRKVRIPLLKSLTKPKSLKK